VGSQRTRYVVKATPPGRKPVGRHDVLRQAAVLQALHSAGAPGIPRVIATDRSVEPFFVMKWCPGEAAEPALGESPKLAAADLLGRAYEAAALLATLHAVDPRAAGIHEPATDPLGEFERWTATMATVEKDLRDGAALVEDALRADPPVTSRTCVVHGDFRLGNVLCSGARAETIIDWEIWSVGDPRVDLGWFLLFCDPANFPGVGAQCSMPPAGRLLDVYTESGGTEPAEIVWFDALARYKMAAIMGNNLARHRSGRYHDPFQERLEPTIRHLISTAAQLLGAG
jgi:streptomycin 6-kinase